MRSTWSSTAREDDLNSLGVGNNNQIYIGLVCLADEMKPHSQNSAILLEEVLFQVF